MKAFGWGAPSATRKLVAGPVLLVALLCVGALGAPPASAGVKPNAYGNLDCNGFSPIQHPVHVSDACRDLANPSEDDDRFEDNGNYIGHDEPDLNFTSSAPGSGDDVTWTFTVGADPAAHATVTAPGHDVSKYFELTPALWFSMNLCDPQSYPLLPCKPESDSNAPKCKNQFECNTYPGGGSAFLEMQFYPPGFPPWVDSTSVDDHHWAAALTIDSLESTQGFEHINENCAEPVNFAWIQHDGVPTGPPSPQLATFATNTPNKETLLMSQGDKISVHLFDATTPEGGKAIEAVVTDLTTGEKGFMQGSAANGFMNTSFLDCSGTPFDFQPEYSTAKAKNLSPWGAGTEVISASFETGHFEPCTKVTEGLNLKLFPGITDKTFNHCEGSYEDSGTPDEEPQGEEEEVLEPGDGECYKEGDTHGVIESEPDTVTGCIDALFQNGDLDFDGTPYWTEWPTGTTPTNVPSTFQFEPPTIGGPTTQYSRFQFQTDLAFSELSTCLTPEDPSGCTVPPTNAPGKFYPYWTLVKSPSTGKCVWEFGNVQEGDTFHGDRQYGKINPNNWPDFSSRFIPNTCST